jgi:glycosyltransferase involved in cell wall biosynthesis
MQLIEAHFAKSTIKFNVDLLHRKAFKYGKKLIGTTHGDGAKVENLPMLLATEFPILWSETKHRYIFSHHVHHKISKDMIGVTFETLRSPSGTDAWHHKNGYTGVPKSVEGFIFPKLKHVFTVNETIAGIYRALYHVPVRVVRNIPMLQQPAQAADRKALGLADGEHVILLQGAFIDPDRGGMELVQSMQWVRQAVLFVIGTGRDLDAMKREVVRLNLESSVRFIPKLPYQELRAYTAIADVGVSLDKPLHLNYAYSLPNKVFDYIHAGVPLLVSDLPELRRLVETHNVGKIVRAVTPEDIAKALNEMLQSEERMQWRENALKAREVLNWQNESLVLREVYAQLV